MADIQLEMQKTFREEENVSFVQHGGIELVIGVNESHVQRTLDNVQDLGGSWGGEERVLLWRNLCGQR